MRCYLTAIAILWAAVPASAQELWLLATMADGLGSEPALVGVEVRKRTASLGYGAEVMLRGSYISKIDGGAGVASGIEALATWNAPRWSLGLGPYYARTDTAYSEDLVAPRLMGGWSWARSRLEARYTLEAESQQSLEVRYSWSRWRTAVVFLDHGQGEAWLVSLGFRLWQRD